MDSVDSGPPLSEAEFQVLKLLWNEGPSPAGRVRDVINHEGRDWAYTTTKTILDRLEEKGYVRRNRESIPHVFSAIVSASGLARMRLEEVRGEIFDGEGLPFVRALLDSVRLSPEEVAELRASLDELEAGASDDE